MNWENLCQICQEQSASYKCPKCQLRYCSLICYRNELHKKCSKKFDENEFFDSMNIDDNEQRTTTTTNEFVRERIEDIFKRKLDEKDFHNEDDNEQIDELFEHILPTKDSEINHEEPIDDDDDDDDDDEQDGEECVASDEEPLPNLPDDIDESDENVNQLWNYLTTEEKHEFKSMLADGRISHLLNDYKPWKPWWLYKTQSPALVTDLETTTATSSTLPDTIPIIISNIIPLPSLTSILPHVHVRFDLFEILFGYVLINIRYRGDFNSYIFESGTEFLHISSRHLIHKSQIFDEQQDPISILQTRISLIREHLQEKNNLFHLSQEFFVNLLADILMIIHGPYSHQTPSNIYVLSALSDIKQFLIKIQDYKSPIESTTTPTPILTNVFHTNRIIKNNSKLCTHHQQTVVKKTKNAKPFNRKLLQSITHKIDYLLSWTITHSNRLLMLEFELNQIEQELRHQLKQYQHDKKRIETNFERIRLQQKNLIQEL